jgi:hypothetical protein
MKPEIAEPGQSSPPGRNLFLLAAAGVFGLRLPRFFRRARLSPHNVAGIGDMTDE